MNKKIIILCMATAFLLGTGHTEAKASANKSDNTELSTKKEKKKSKRGFLFFKKKKAPLSGLLLAVFMDCFSARSARFRILSLAE